MLGAGDDAFVVPHGTLRIAAGAWWSTFDQVYATTAAGTTSSTATPFGAAASVDPLGAMQIPAIAAAERDLRGLTTTPDLQLSLGRTRVSADAAVLTTPVVAEVGLFGRLSLGVMVPYVFTRTDVHFDVDASTANAGFNPARADETALAANAALRTQFEQAAAGLGALLSTCEADPAADPRCGDVNARRAEALALIGDANQFADGVAQLYGVSAGSGALFVPLAGSDAQRRIDERVAGFRTGYESFGFAGVITATGPTAARAPVGALAAQTILTDPAFGVRGDTLRTVERGHIGDVEVGVKLKLLDSFGGRTADRLAARGFNYRVAVAGVYRLGTGHARVASDPLDFGRGDGQNDIEVRPAVDLLFGRRLWASVVARVGYQQKDEQLVRIPERPDVAIVPSYRRQRVERKLGDYYEVEASPRYVFNDYLAVTAQYFYRHKAEDEYSGRFTIDSATTGVGAIELDAAALGAGTEQTEHRVGGAVAFSTVGAYNRRKARIPLEITYSHTETVRGAGGNLPKLSVDQVQLRVYTRLFGGPR